MPLNLPSLARRTKLAQKVVMFLGEHSNSWMEARAILDLADDLISSCPFEERSPLPAESVPPSPPNRKPARHLPRL